MVVAVMEPHPTPADEGDCSSHARAPERGPFRFEPAQYRGLDCLILCSAGITSQSPGLARICELPSLRKLYLDWNGLTDFDFIAGDLPGLSDLSGFSNALRSIDGIRHLSGLKWLNVGANPALRLTEGLSCPSVGTLLIKGYPALDVAAIFACFPGVTHLSCDAYLAGYPGYHGWSGQVSAFRSFLKKWGVAVKTEAEMAGTCRHLKPFAVPHFAIHPPAALERLCGEHGVVVIDGASRLRAADKFATFEALHRAGVRTPRTVRVDFDYWAEAMRRDAPFAFPTFPCVLKPTNGTRGEGVVLVEDRAALWRHLRRVMAGCEEQGWARGWVLQECMRHSLGTDVRAFVLRGEVVKCMRRIAGSADEFRAGVDGRTTDPLYRLSPEHAAMAVAATRALGLFYAGVDMLFVDPGRTELCVNEVNPGCAFSGYDVPEEVLRREVAKQVILHTLRVAQVAGPGVKGEEEEEEEEEVQLQEEDCGVLQPLFESSSDDDDASH